MSHIPLSAPQGERRSIRSFSLRGGRTTAAQKRAIETHWSTYGLDLQAGMVDFAAVFGRPADLILEIGFGDGLSLIQQAENEPDKNFIGIEVYAAGIGQTIRHIVQQAIANIRLYHADALDVLELCIPDHAISRLQLYFPDPWMKKKHLKRRLVRPDTIDRFLRILKPDALWHLATDSWSYAEAMATTIRQAGQSGCTIIAGKDKSCFVERPNWRYETKFERAGLAAGHKIYELLVSPSSENPAADRSKNAAL